MAETPILSSETVARFATDGFLRIPDLTTPADLVLIRSLLDPLFERFDELPRDRAFDLAGGGAPPGTFSIPEVNRPSAIIPALRQTKTFARCRAAARTLLRAPVGYVFDHAIYKPPHNHAATDWHQDEAYTGRPVPQRTVHFWIPLQPATVENGCMWFVPGSHRNGLLPHEERSSRGRGGMLVAQATDINAAVPCPLGAGGGTVHGPRTLHYTGPNDTDEFRRAWIVHFGAYGRLGILHPRNVLAKIRDRVSRA